MRLTSQPSLQRRTKQRHQIRPEDCGSRRINLRRREDRDTASITGEATLLPLLEGLPCKDCRNARGQDRYAEGRSAANGVEDLMK
jgi:hypothetical protein